MRATWYLLEDVTAVDPNEVTRDESGALVHEKGKVAIGDHGNYRTAGVDLDEQKTEDMKAEPNPAPAKKPGYKTRGK